MNCLFCYFLQRPATSYQYSQGHRCYWRWNKNRVTDPRKEYFRKGSKWSCSKTFQPEHPLTLILKIEKGTRWEMWEISLLRLFNSLFYHSFITCFRSILLALAHDWYFSRRILCFLLYYSEKMRFLCWFIVQLLIEHFLYFSCHLPKVVKQPTIINFSDVWDSFEVHHDYSLMQQQFYFQHMPVSFLLCVFYL